MDFIYQVDAYNRTPNSVAVEFALRYWDHPRKIEDIREENEHTLFSVENGSRIYEVVYLPAIRLVSNAKYQIRVWLAVDQMNNTDKITNNNR